MIEWTPKLLEDFKKVYEENKDVKVFKWNEHDFIPAYAKYLIEYLEGEFKKRGL